MWSRERSLGACVVLLLASCRTAAPTTTTSTPPPAASVTPDEPPATCAKARAQIAKFDKGPEPADPVDGTLTLARVRWELVPNPDLVFLFRTGPDNPELTCAQLKPPTVENDGPHETTWAMKVGWLDRRCENDHIQLRLTETANKLSPRWGRSGETLCGPRVDDDVEGYNWFVTAATFESIAPPQVLPTKSPDEKRVIVKGRWVMTDDGKILKASGWRHLKSLETVREERFIRMPSGQWHMVGPHDNDL